VSGLAAPSVTLWAMVLSAAPAWASVDEPRPDAHHTVQLLALVIGCNTTHDPEVPALRYADDDAIQNAKLMGQLGADVVLLVSPDQPSRSLHRDLQAQSPTKAAVLSAMTELNRRMRAARAHGRTPIFYFFYSGHGEVRNNQGQVTLADSVLSRDEFLELLRSSDAAVNHVVIDACKSYFVVFERGASGTRHKVRDSLSEETHAVPANVGIFLSTSAATDSHEWEAFQGGVFNHEMRSALRGAADVNGDGLVTYEEAAAFIWNANRAIPNPRYRPHFFFRPAIRGSDATAILADLRIAKGDRFVMQATAGGRAFVENASGTRYLDLHPGKIGTLRMLLPTERPLFIRWPAEGTEAEIPPGSPVAVAALVRRSLKTLVRGAEHVAFARLFSHPFDAASVVAFRARPAEEEISATPLPTDWTWPRRGLGVAAVALGIAGGVLTAFANHEQESVRPGTSGLDRARVNQRIDDFNTAAVSCYAVAGAAAVSYLIWTLWPRPSPAIHLQPPVTTAGRVELSLAW
jgi:hypothetical protein